VFLRREYMQALCMVQACVGPFQVQLAGRTFADVLQQVIIASVPVTS
jgi:hypothetical protein